MDRQMEKRLEGWMDKVRKKQRNVWMVGLKYE